MICWDSSSCCVTLRYSRYGRTIFSSSPCSRASCVTRAPLTATSGLAISAASSSARATIVATRAIQGGSSGDAAVRGVSVGILAPESWKRPQ